jgi:hypothetical protein
MVHALSEAGRVLRRGGRLLDLRPTMRNRRVELVFPDATLFIGEIDSSSTFSDHIAANDAIDRALAAGEFQLEHRATFQIRTDLDSLADLVEIRSGLRRSVMPETILTRITALIADEPAAALIRIRREMLIARYRRQ